MPRLDRSWFADRVTQEGDCWIWSGGRATNGVGYGVKWFNGKRWYVHRLAYTMLVGVIPPGILVCHKCDRPLCVHPEHLFLGTSADNLGDMARKGRHGTKVLGTAHLPHGETHYKAKITDADAREIRRLAAGGMKQRPIAALFGISQPMVGYIVRRQSWKHVA